MPILAADMRPNHQPLFSGALEDYCCLYIYNAANKHHYLHFYSLNICNYAFEIDLAWERQPAVPNRSYLIDALFSGVS